MAQQIVLALALQPFYFQSVSVAKTPTIGVWLFGEIQPDCLVKSSKLDCLVKSTQTRGETAVLWFAGYNMINRPWFTGTEKMMVISGPDRIRLF